MPAGEPNKHTKEDAKWREANGYVVKSFKMKKDVVQEFEKACKECHIAQNAAITELMRQFVYDHS